MLGAADPAAALTPARIPVAFPVVNRNDSGVACPSDLGSYTVRGQLVGPAWVLAGPGPRTVTVYLYGFGVAGWSWSLDLPGYDHAAEMARFGHVSLVIDSLGHGASVEAGGPHGALVCIGSDADVASQIVEQLRNGSYTVESGGAPLAFSQVVLAGHDVGGAVSEVAQYSFSSADALLVFGWAEQGFTEFALSTAAEAGPVCAAGGEEAFPGGPSGYFFFVDEQTMRDTAFHDADPEVVEAAVAQRTRNPCGWLSSIGPTTATNPGRLGEIEVPVLLVYTDQDVIYTPEGTAQQEAHFTGSDDVTTEVLVDTGHFPMFERRAPAFRAVVSQWLCARQLARGGQGCPPPVVPALPTRGRVALAVAMLLAGAFLAARRRLG